MIKVNNYSIEHWDHCNYWFVCFPDGSGISIPDKYSFSLVLKNVLFWIHDGIKSMFEI